MDQREWGACIDVKVKANYGPIIAGVVTPVLTIGAAAALFFFRGKIIGKLSPEKGSANPDRVMWKTIFLGFVVMILGIISCSVPNWSESVSFRSGPWQLCPATSDCTNAAATGLPAIHFVRFFVISAVIMSVFAMLAPIAVFYGRIEAMAGANLQLICNLWIGTATFISFMLWICILNAGSDAGWALYMDIVVFCLAFLAAALTVAWRNHIVAAPAVKSEKSTPFVTSGPIIKSEASANIPKSYPTAGGAVKSYPTSNPAVAVAVSVPAPPSARGKAPPKKWGAWEEIWDAENQAYYFFNHTDGSSIWEPPSGWPHPVS